MRYLKIQEVGKIVSGSTPKTGVEKYWNGSVPWVTPKEINRLDSQYLNKTERRISEEGFKSCSTTMLPKGSVLFTSRAPIGLIAIANIEVCTNQGFKSIIPNKDINSLYLYYVLKTNAKRLDDLGTGSTFRELSKSTFQKFQIPVPDLPDQRHIANILSKAEALIAQRKQSIALLDELLKSTFLEMFGDPVRNEKGWPLLKVNEISESRLGKMLDGKKIIGNNLKPYLRNSNVLWFKFKLDELLEMDFDEKDKMEFSLKHGDILMCEGGEIGRCAIWKNELKECYFQKAIHRIRLHKDIVIPEFFVFMFWVFAAYDGLKQFMGAATISHLTGQKLKGTKLPMPPLKLQTKFAQIVKKTDALKTNYQQSLQELENLYGSLSQRAFKGELKMSEL